MVIDVARARDYLLKVMRDLIRERLEKSRENHVEISFYEILSMVPYSNTYVYSYFRSLCMFLGGEYERGRCVIKRETAEKIMKNEGVYPD